MLIPKLLRDKLKSNTWKCKLIGSLENESDYKFHHFDKGLIESRDANFLKNTEIVTLVD